MPGTVEELQQSVAKILRKVDKIPLEDIGNHTRDTLANLNASAQNLDKLLQRLEGEVAPESTAALADLRKTLTSLQKSVGSDSPLQQDLRQTLRETTRAVQAVRALADTLDREPEALIRGKTDD
jgi:paraquat-inducible protein B